MQGGGQVPEYSPELLRETRERLRSVLGEVWNRIEAADNASLPGRERHLLTVLDRHAARFEDDFTAHRFPGHLPDLMALTLVVNILERSASDPVFSEILPGLADRGEFRHHMLTLGLADHLRRYTSYPVRLPTRSCSGARIVDLVIETVPEIYVETKGSREFDGPLRSVSPTNAFKGIKQAWRRAFGGDHPQVPDDVTSALLVGGVTVEVSSMGNIQRRARDWLSRRGADHRLCWGILAMTFLTVSRIPPGRRIGDGAPITVNAIASPLLIGIHNPHYRGTIQLVLTPPQW
jgi:hypothetical protein